MRSARAAILLSWAVGIVGVAVALNGWWYIGMLAMVPCELIRRANFSDRATLKEFAGLHPRAFVMAIASTGALVSWMCIKSLSWPEGDRDGWHEFIALAMFVPFIPGLIFFVAHEIWLYKRSET
jgi:hypothetical protein